ncbi:uncharacterized protein LOC111019927 [Momordica charantia]|uniref:Uncharacterized protein LOC111019927 n=1 Tax=Momordica charantia TaxID=3673 RepID=A0A6J1DFG6_MOMCH|nr:uncharacterized protein LOC111019927 [Momordica charantia]
MAAAFSSCFRPSSGRRRRRHHHPPPPISGFPNLTTCVYHTDFAMFSLSWSRSLLSRSLLLHFQQNPKPFDSPHSSESSSISFRLLLRPLILWKNHGSEKLSPTVHVFWDLRRANFSSSPEPHSGFFIAVVVDAEIVLLLGDMIKEAHARTRATTNPSELLPQSLVLKREHVIAHKIYTTRARFGGRIREIEIDCGLFSDESRLSFGVDGERILEIKRLKWKFRGNERIEVAGVPVHIYWDVYNWVFETGKENRTNAVFMFRFEEEDEEQSDSVARHQNWNFGLNELEWRRMRSSLSSSSASISSAGSSAGASSSIMEWANTEETDSNAAPMGFSLLIYAWRR